MQELAWLLHLERAALGTWTFVSLILSLTVITLAIQETVTENGTFAINIINVFVVEVESYFSSFISPSVKSLF